MALRSTPKERVAKHRQMLRDQGLRPVQLWIPDVRSPVFRAEAKRQSQLVASSEHEADDQRFVDAIADPDAL